MALAFGAINWSNARMQIHAQAVVEVPRPSTEVFDYTVAGENFATIMGARGLIPGVVSVTLIDATVVTKGVRRRVALSDNSYVIEEVLDMTRPSRQAYRWDSKLKFPLSLLVAGAEAEWLYTPTPSGGTRIEWNYDFTLTTPLVYPLATIMVSQFRAWMAHSLATVQREMLRAA